MPTDEWERGYSAGYRAAHRTDVRDITSDRGETASKPKRQRSAAARKRDAEYRREFKKAEPRFKKKSGGWKKNGFKNCGAAARRAMK